MTKQELIQNLKNLSVSKESSLHQKAINLIIDYVVSDSGEIGYWLDRCVDPIVESFIVSPDFYPVEENKSNEDLMKDTTNAIKEEPKKLSFNLSSLKKTENFLNPLSTDL